MYLLDSNIFIEAKNRYYAFDICPGFWTWMDEILARGGVKSIGKVFDELIKGDDELAEWVKERNQDNIFLKVSDEPTQRAFVQIAHVVQNRNYTLAAQAHFLQGADPWLIAKAMSLHATVITHEMPAPNSRKTVYIPDLCNHFGVPYMNTFEMLRQLSASFVLDSHDFF